jgi:4-aminobutyrate aminotransferase-like enzyme
MYRGEFAQDKNAAYLYAKKVDDLCCDFSAKNKGIKASDHHGGENANGLAAFFIESGMSVAGVIIPPDGYMKHCFDCVHSAGGVNICDEVQVGFGRFGESFWAFEQVCGGGR